MEKVLLDPLFRKRDQVFSTADLARLRSVADLVWAADGPAPDDLIESNKDDIEAIITGYWRYGDVARFPRLRAILEVGGTLPSVDQLDYAACFQRRIRVLSCAPAFAPSVAEMALGMAIAAARGIVDHDRPFRSGEESWDHHASNRESFLLYDKTVGFIGYGNLARRLQGLLAPFRCSIQVYDPWLTPDYLSAEGVKARELDDLLETSRVVFVLATPSRGNRALLDRNRLERIRSDSVLVLISRAHLVDFDALTYLLLAGRFRAAIDVFPDEPFAKDHPIRGASSAILSAHRAGGTPEAMFNIGRMVVNDLTAILNGRAPQEMQSAQPEYLQLRDEKGL